MFITQNMVSINTKYFSQHSEGKPVNERRAIARPRLKARLTKDWGAHSLRAPKPSNCLGRTFNARLTSLVGAHCMVKQ